MTELEAIDWCEQFRDNIIATGVEKEKYTLALKAMRTAITALKNRKWIPVSEPPKERGCYLISVKHWLDGKPVTREAFWNGADWLSCYCKKGDRVELTPRVTHWMPLPEAPKGE